MTNFNVRVCTSRLVSDLQSEMRKVGADWGGIDRMIPKALGLVVKLHGIRTPAALILKEEMLSKGGDAVIHRDCITGKIPHSDVLLLGSKAVLDRVIASLQAQAFDLPRIAGEIRLAISNSQGLRTPDDPPARLTRFYSDLRERTAVMGILNVTPDSFSDGGQFSSANGAINHAVQMAADGADIIDVGGESSRPGAEPISADEEISRVVPVIEGLAKRIETPISIDTYKPEVARAALEAGADMINDITGLSDPAMRTLAAERQVPSVVMHMLGTPRTMQEDPVYEDVIAEVLAFLRKRVGEIVEAGLPEEYLIVDPGIGFGKTVEHNLEIIRKLGDFESLGLPILIGPSRKAFIGKVLGGLPASDRLEGTAAAVAVSIANGANIVRVHDAKEMARVARMTDALSDVVDTE